MSLKTTNEAGEEIEVYTAAEVQERETAARTAAEGEWKPKVEDLTGKLTAAEQAAAQRAVEFGHFRKLSEDQVKKLSEQEAIIYNNQLKLEEANGRNETNQKTAHENAVATAIRAKIGTDESLFTKVKDMYALIGIEATTTEQIEKKVLATLGAIGQTEPNLLATVNGFSGGSYQPPKPTDKKDGESFADTDKGKGIAAILGLTLEKPKK